MGWDGSGAGAAEALGLVLTRERYAAGGSAAVKKK